MAGALERMQAGALVSSREAVADSDVARAFLSPLHAALLAALACAAIVASSPMPLLFGAPFAEMFALVALPRTVWFRKRADDARRRRAQEKKEAERESLMLRMGMHHRDVADELRALVSAVSVRLSEHGSALQHDLQVEELLDAYLRVAAMHEDGVRLLDRTHADEWALAPGAQVSPLQATVARRRLALRSEKSAKLQQMTEQLACLEGLIKLVHEKTILAADLSEVAVLIDASLDELDCSDDLIDAVLASAPTVSR